MVKLVPIGDVRASEYNPRKNDEKRLALTEMSLRKLGFLLPIYADKDGEILSGHQRHLVAERMGFDKIPVQYVDQEDLNSRKTLNVLFNRATNDLQKQDTCTKIKKRLYNMDIDGMCADLPDIEPGSEASYPCVYACRRIDTVLLAKKNHRDFDSHMKALAKALEKKTDHYEDILSTYLVKLSARPIGQEDNAQAAKPGSGGGRQEVHPVRGSDGDTEGVRVCDAESIIYGFLYGIRVCGRTPVQFLYEGAQHQGDGCGG